MHRDSSAGYLLFEGLISTEQQLLPRLASRIEGWFDLHSARKGPIVQKSAISLAKGTPCATHWSMMFPLTSARRYTLASRAR